MKTALERRKEKEPAASLASPPPTPSRQLLWQRLRIAKGLCPQCAREALLPDRGIGLKCLIKRRKLERERKGWKPWREGKAGRPPLEKVRK